MTKIQLRQLKAATKKLTKWDSSGKAFGHFKVIEANATNLQLINKKGADKIYEFYCLMLLLENLLTNYKITLKPGTIIGKIFPENPAPKKGWPYFEIAQKNGVPNKFQICYGTKIKLTQALKTTIAPDISIQKYTATDDPDETMVELIMDAKFKYTDTNALPIDQIHAFIQRVNALQVQNASAINLLLTAPLINIKGNCLLTNGKALQDQKDYCKLNNILQVEQFDIGKTHNVVG